ncbi:MFS transporter [Pseudomonas cichorii]|nr:MFS transporter [Pseudomonas cichorii]
MKTDTSSTSTNAASPTAAWGAVLAMAMAAFALVASEFMPVSLLTPIARDLLVTEGQAGQAIAVSGAFALITSLCVSALAGHLNRKVLLASLTLLMIISGTVVAFAPNYAVFMVGRALIGVAIGGFWSLSAATAMRLVPEDKVPRALAILNSGNALATVIAASLGSFLSSIIGWRLAFFAVVPVAVIALCWKLFSLPSMKPEAERRSGNVFKLLKRKPVAFGMAASSLFFMGQFSLYTYLRPFLESVTQVDVSTLSFLLLLVGVAGFLGTLLIGGLLKNGVYRVLTFIPLLMAVLAISLTYAYVGSSLWLTAVALGLWGLVATAAPVGWWTWLARTMPQDAEAGGGLLVAVVQLAIMLGATLGGVLFDHYGYSATFEMSAALLIISAVLTVMTARAQEQEAQHACDSPAQTAQA